MNTEYVDLGLPSGTLWAKCNLGAEKETDFGHFFQWGDTQDYSIVGHQFNWVDYKWGTSWDKIAKYNVSDCKSILDNKDDPAFVATNDEQKMPTKEQLRELINCTNHEWTNIDGVRGMKFWKKGMEEPTDGDYYIFIPAAGYCDDGRHYDIGSWGSVWSASRNGSNASHAWYMYFDANGVDMYCSSRCYGRSVRGVAIPDEIDDTDDGQPVDLGLPSGTKWMKSNIGATKPSDFGKFFQWGDTQGYEDASEHLFKWRDYKWGSYKILTKYNDADQLTLLEASDDSAVAATGGQASMPTKIQLEELIDNTEHRWLRLANGVNGIKFWKKGTEEPTEGNSYIFIPAAGVCVNGSHDDVAYEGCVWSASCVGSNVDYAWYMSFKGDYVEMYHNSRCIGFSVRGIVPQVEPFDEIDDTDDGQPVDLGLPSGTKWMKSNIGATKPSDFGKFFQWGDTQGYEDASEHQFNWNEYKWRTSGNLAKYNNTDGLTLLEASDDSAVAATGGQASMPTKDQLQELIDKTEHRWLCLANGVNGMKFWKKGADEPTDGDSYLFIPAAGVCGFGNHDSVGSWGSVWSDSCHESYANCAWLMCFNASNINMGHGCRCGGFSVRGVVNSKKLHNNITKPKGVITTKHQVDNDEKIAIDKKIYNQLVRLGIIDSCVRADNQGNSDYAKHIIQPWSIWIDWNLNPWDADIVKRVLRTKDGEPRELDYRKIIHICNERIRQSELTPT